jgi:hypothetical protein
VTSYPSNLFRDLPLHAPEEVVEKAFDRLPILADALQDAGCEDATILGHCRNTNHIHVRGCWACDLVLEKE